MSRNKFNLKDKKTKIIISIIVLCIILLGSLGFGLATLNSTDSKDIAYNKNKTENKKEDKKEETSLKEETKKEDTKTEGTNTSSTDNKTESNEETSSSGSSSNSSNGSSSESGSSSSNNNVVAPPSNGGGSSSSSSNGGGTSNPPAHSHSWNPIYDTIHHEEVGHWEDVLIQEGYVEYVPIYEEQAREICNGCGADITADPYAHMEQQMDAGNMKCSGFTTEYRQVQVGTEEVKHGPVYDKKYVVDKAAWDETVTTGYQCSCGATK